MKTDATEQMILLNYHDFLKMNQIQFYIRKFFIKINLIFFLRIKMSSERIDHKKFLSGPMTANLRNKVSVLNQFGVSV